MPFEALDRLLQFKGLAESELVVLRIGAVKAYQREALGEKDHREMQVASAGVAVVVATECPRKSVHESH